MAAVQNLYWPVLLDAATLLVLFLFLLFLSDERNFFPIHSSYTRIFSPS